MHEPKELNVENYSPKIDPAGCEENEEEAKSGKNTFALIADGIERQRS